MKMLEDYLIRFCSPTLASLKSGSLFNCKCASNEPLEECINDWNRIFRSRGIVMHLLRRTSSTALIYVYRESAIKSTLDDPEIRSFLMNYGYDTCSCCEGCTAATCSIDKCLQHLQTRIECDHDNSTMRFPHEIGVFLGYPLSDVAGFITNNGKNSKYTGTWKVYGDPSSARKTFARFDKCNAVYNKLWNSGKRSVLQLTVAG